MASIESSDNSQSKISSDVVGGGGSSNNADGEEWKRNGDVF
jgi:hypothetical protein